MKNSCIDCKAKPKMEKQARCQSCRRAHDALRRTEKAQDQSKIVSSPLITPKFESVILPPNMPRTPENMDKVRKILGVKVGKERPKLAPLFPAVKNPYPEDIGQKVRITSSEPSRYQIAAEVLEEISVKHDRRFTTIAINLGKPSIIQIFSEDRKTLNGKTSEILEAACRG